MTKTPLALALLIAVIGLVATNPGIRKSSYQETCEISSSDYAKLHAAIDQYSEIATMARQDLTQEFVSIAEYNKIMHQVDIVKLKHARQMAAMQDRTR